MITASPPKPRPDSSTVSSRDRPAAGVMSPSPRVKKVVPLKYRSAARPAGVPWSGSAVSPQWSRAKPKIRLTIHEANRPSMDSGPKMPSVASRVRPAGRSIAARRHRVQAVR